MDKTVNFSDISESLANKASTSRSVAIDFLQELFEIISDRLIMGENVVLTGIGEFRPIDNNGTIDVIFVPDDSFILSVNAPFEQFEPIELTDNIDDSILDSTAEISPVEEIAISQASSAIENNTDGGNDYDGIIFTEATDGVEIEYPADMPPPPTTLPTTATTTVVVADKHDDTSVADNSVELSAEDVHIPSAQQPKDVQESKPIEEPMPQPAVDSSTSAVSQTPPTELYFDDNEKRGIEFSWFSFLIGLVVGGAIAYGLFVWTDSADNETTRDAVNKEFALAVDTTNTCLQTDSLSEIADTVPIVTDKITKRRFLATMAREHYGNAAFWVYIYEENKDHVGPNPNNIKIGTEVIIPPASKYAIDASNPESVNAAKKKAGEYVKK